MIGVRSNVDPALRQEILDVAQRQRVFHVHHHDQTDHCWRAVEIPERVTHGLMLPRSKTAPEFGLTTPHGGGWVNGAGTDVQPTWLTAEGNVLVTVNYRLGALGYLALPALDAESADKPFERPVWRSRQGRSAALGAEKHRGLRGRSRTRDDRGAISGRWIGVLADGLAAPGRCHLQMANRLSAI